MSAVEHDLIFRKPRAEDAPEIERFRREFEEDGSSMDGTGSCSHTNSASLVSPSAILYSIQILLPCRHSV